MREKVLVTGAGGFIGSYLVNFLAGRDYSVFGTVYKRQSPVEISSKAELVNLDIRQTEAVDKLIRKIKPAKIYHLAAQSFPTVSWEKPQETIETNVIGTINLYEAIKINCPDCRVLSIGSSAQYGYVPLEKAPVKEFYKMFPLHPYGISKVAQELLALQYFKNFAIKSIVIRTFNTTGPGKENDVISDFTKRVVLIEKKRQKPILKVGNLTPKRAFADVRDIVEAFYLGMEKGKTGEVYNVCGSKVYSVKEVLDLILKISKIKVKVAVDKTLLRPTDEPIIFGDSARFRKKTGWQPKISLEKTIYDTLCFWRENIA